MRFPAYVAQLNRFLLALFATISFSGVHSASNVQAQNPIQIELEHFDFMDAASGWILSGQHLFWTSDAGQTWGEISPSIPPDASVQAVRFIDSSRCWVLWTTASLDGSTVFWLSQTFDTGKTWTGHSLILFEAGEIASYARKADMGWFDLQHGWISVKQNSGSNFSLGTLFTTSDGGISWRRMALPAADKIHFSDPQNGWAMGEPASQQIFGTVDAGATWKNTAPSDSGIDDQAITYPPVISDGRGLLVVTTSGMENTLRVYSLKDFDTWLPLGQVELDGQPGLIGLSILDGQNFVATVPGTSSIVQMKNGKLNTLENTDGLSASIVELDMLSLDNGWAKSVHSSCVTASLSDPNSAAVSCATTARLLQTDNGGITWREVNLPRVASDAAIDSSGIEDTMTMSTASLSANTALFVGQGFDKCEIPTVSQMQTWWDNSPYKTVNLYIGGSSRACANSALKSSFLFQLNQQGWKFFPTWVGPQAPCTGYASRISSDVATAYTQGVNQANLAVDRLAELGLTGPDKTGSVVYYDIENYGTNLACRSAVNAFMDGWVSQIHGRGGTAGVYGSTLCDTGLSDFLTIPNVPDVIWPARWYHGPGQGYYDPTATVWDLGSCIPNSAWSNHQRIRQYEGDHDETWGGLTLNIDSDVLDGVVAFPYDYPQVSTVVRSGSNPTNSTTVDFTVDFSKSVTGVNKSDFVLTTTGITGASILTVTGSGTTYTVNVNRGTGEGTIRLDVVDDDTVRDAFNNSLGGAGAGNGSFTWGEVYDIVFGSWFGGVTIQSDRNIVTVGRPHIGNQVMAYNGSASGGRNAYVPMLFKEAFGSYNAALYVQNVDSANTANVTLHFYDSDGNETCSQNDTITPFASKGYWIPNVTCLPTGWVGGVKVESDRDIVAVGRPHIGEEVLTYNGFASGSLNSYVPMLFKQAFGGSYNAALYIQNVDAANTANITIRFYDNAGNESCSQADTIAPLAAKGYWVPDITCLPIGWVGGVKVESDRNIVAVGRPHIGSQVTAYDGFAAGRPNAYVPMLFKESFGGSYNSALYIQNADAVNTANITIKYYDNTGNLTCSQPDAIAPLASKGYWIPSIRCLPTGWVGGVRIESDANIVAVGRPHIGEEVLTYNGFGLGSLNAYAPMMFMGAFGGAYNSALYIQNLSLNNTANITIRLYDASGNLSCTIQDNLSALGAKGYWLPSLSCPP